jgi:hypothetical protein
MDTQSIKLTIAIPSRTIPETLFYLLEEIKNQFKFIEFPQILDIVISLNTRETMNLDKLEQFTHGWARVIKNSSGETYDEHLDFIVSNSKGKWIKFIADDDIFLPNALAELLILLEKKSDIKGLVHDFSYLHDKINVDKAKGNVALSSISRASGQWGQLSCTLFLREAWLNLPTVRETDYLHAFKFELLINRTPNQVFYLDKQLVSVRPGSPNFTHDSSQRIKVASRSVYVIKLLCEHGVSHFQIAKRKRRSLVDFARTLAFVKIESGEYYTKITKQVLRFFPFNFWNISIILVLISPLAWLEKIKKIARKIQNNRL